MTSELRVVNQLQDIARALGSEKPYAKPYVKPTEAAHGPHSLENEFMNAAKFFSTKEGHGPLAIQDAFRSDPQSLVDTHTKAVNPELSDEYSRLYGLCQTSGKILMGTGGLFAASFAAFCAGPVNPVIFGGGGILGMLASGGAAAVGKAMGTQYLGKLDAEYDKLLDNAFKAASENVDACVDHYQQQGKLPDNYRAVLEGTAAPPRMLALNS